MIRNDYLRAGNVLPVEFFGGSVPLAVSFTDFLHYPAKKNGGE